MSTTNEVEEAVGVAAVWRACRGSVVFHAALGLWAALSFVAFVWANTWLGIVGVPVAAGIALLPLLRRRMSSFVVVLVCVPLWLAIGEFVFRAHFFGPDALANPTAYSPVSNFYMPGMVELSDDPVLGFELTPGFSGRFKGTDLELNPQGFRDDPFVARSPGDGFRIVAVGDSITLGSGVVRSAIFSDRLEAILSTPSRRVEVYNCSVAGMKVVQLARLAERAAEEWDPDLILLALRPTAVTDRLLPERVDWSEVLARNAETARAMAWLRRYGFVPNLFAPPVRQIVRFIPGLERDMPEDARASSPVLDGALRSLSRLSRDGTPVVGVGLRLVSVGPAGAPAQKRAHDQLAQAFREHDLEFIDTFDAFPESYRPVDFTIYPGDGHPNAAAHDRIARTIAAALEAGWSAQRGGAG